MEKISHVAEVNDSIFVLDAGLKYPENEQLRVDVVIPNMDYLFENRDRIAGVFLTHGHADAIGALPYLLAEAKVPVFGTELTIELAKLLSKAMTVLRNLTTSMSSIKIQRLILVMPLYLSFKLPTPSLKVSGL